MSETKATDPRDTKSRILDAATHLFADHGFDATSLRGITTAAGVNLAAVNYHFGSKEALIPAVFQRLLEPINRARLERLDAVEAQAGSDPPRVESIVAAFVEPVMDLTWGERGRPLRRLFAQTIGQPNPQIREAFVEQFAEIVARFSRSLKRALPDFSDDEIRWKILFMAGATAHAMSFGDEMATLSGATGVVSAEATTRRLVPFVSAGMHAAAGAGGE
jgi:AcrR family transcriptional regulator